MTLDERLLKLAVKRGALKYGEFTLSSGQIAHYYFDGRLLSLDPEGAYLIGRALLPMIKEAGAQAIGGPTLGADPIVAAVAMASHMDGHPVPAFIVRERSKAHGTGQQVRRADGSRKQGGHSGRRVHHWGVPFPRHRSRRGLRVQGSQGDCPP